MPITPQVELEVLARGDGHAVARLVGKKMPFLVLCPGELAELRRLFEAAVLRMRALPDTQPADALVEFVHRFESLLALYDVEAEAYGSNLFECKDSEVVSRELALEISALSQFGESTNISNDSQG